MRTICLKNISSIYYLLYSDKSSSIYVGPVRYFFRFLLLFLLTIKRLSTLFQSITIFSKDFE